VSAWQTFANSPSSVRLARRFVSGRLAPIDPDTDEAVSLMVSELATNSLRHAGTEFTVAVHIAGHVARIEVTDSGPGTPAPRSPSPAEPSGRGLRIVAEMSDDWGVRDDAAGTKTVWFTVTTDARARSSVPR
jgi:anti-sigma regulatory factor (Ser/Thr protein kinase)